MCSQAVLASERVEHPTVQRQAFSIGQRRFDGPACELVVEADRADVRAQQSLAHALRYGALGGTGDRLDQCEIGHAGDHGGEVQDVSGLSRQLGGTRQNRILDARGNLAVASRDQLRHEQRISARQLENLRQTEFGSGEELGDVVRRETIEADPDEVLRGQLPDDPAQGMVGVDLAVAVGEHQQRVRPRDPATEVLDRVECRLVGPVGVLDDENRRSRRVAQQSHRVVPQPLPVACGERLRDRRALVSHVPERAEGLGCGEVVTPSREHHTLPCVARGYLPDEGALADAGLTANEHDRATRCGNPRHARVHRCQFTFPADEHRLWTVQG